MISSPPADRKHILAPLAAALIGPCMLVLICVLTQQEEGWNFREAKRFHSSILGHRYKKKCYCLLKFIILLHNHFMNVPFSFWPTQSSMYK